MGKIYDALQKAEQEAKLFREKPSVPNKQSKEISKETAQDKLEDTVLLEEEKQKEYLLVFH